MPTTLLRILAAAATMAAVLAAPAAAHADHLPTLPRAGETLGPLRIVATAAFPAGKRMVVATVTARTPGRNTMLHATLTCGGQAVHATTNVSNRATLQPRAVMADARRCTIEARAAITRPTARDVLHVTASIESVPVRWGARGEQATGWPTKLTPGSRYDATPVTSRAPAGTTAIRLAGDLKATTCTSTSGSRENGSPNLCTRTNRAGTVLRVSLVGQQRNTDGFYCQQRTVASRLVHVDRLTHHEQIALIGTFPLSRDEHCTRDVRTKIHVQVVSGADLIVHRKGTSTNMWLR